MDSRDQSLRAGITRGVGVLLAGLALAAWIVFGRFLFGVGGDLTLAYLLIGVLVVVLHAFIGRALMRTTARGFTVRRSTWVTLMVSWGCGILLGLTIPDLTQDGLQTILTGAEQPGLDVAIGVANPAWVIMFAFTIIALVLASQDAHGPRPTEDDF